MPGETGNKGLFLIGFDPSIDEVQTRVNMILSEYQNME
jgi:hypothetical protein